MGAKVSVEVSETDILNDIMTNVIIQNSAQCSNSTVIEQTLKFGDIKTKNCARTVISGISQSADVKVNTACLQESKYEGELLNGINAELDKLTDEKTNGLTLGAKGEFEQEITKIKNDIKTTIDISSVMKCVNDAVVSQLTEVGKITIECPDGGEFIMKDMTQKIISTVVGQCIQTNESLLAISARLDAAMEKTKITDDSFMPDSGNLAISGVISCSSCISLVAMLGILAYVGTDENVLKLAEKAV